MDALADGEESVRASTETGQRSLLSYSLQALAEIEAHVGRTESSREHAREAMTVAHESESPVFGQYGRAVLGVLALLEGDAEGGIHELDRGRAELRNVGMPSPGAAFWTIELVEAHVRNGDLETAREELATGEQLIRADHPVYLRAQLARCRALVTEGEESDALFDEALALHAQSQTPFQRARTELAYGERLRRRNVRAESRKHLRAALETFERLGAKPWIDRARSELRASGVLSARESTPVADLLSPHELQVALIVARGATNKEAAATLFVSPKTVEHHLGQIYRKLDIRSRTQLSALLGAQQAGAA
jgi:DNA-binding NarL/FixJ family response regulator